MTLANGDASVNLHNVIGASEANGTSWTDLKRHNCCLWRTDTETVKDSDGSSHNSSLCHVAWWVGSSSLWVLVSNCFSKESHFCLLSKWESEAFCDMTGSDQETLLLLLLLLFVRYCDEMLFSVSFRCDSEHSGWSGEESHRRTKVWTKGASVPCQADNHRYYRRSVPLWRLSDQWPVDSDCSSLL